MYDKEKDIFKLANHIYNHILGNKEDDELFDRWVNESELNQKLYDKFKDKSDLDNRVLEKEEIPVVFEYDELIGRYRKYYNKKKLYRIVRNAAAVLFPIIFVFLLWDNFLELPTSDSQLIASNEHITLYIGDREHFNLQDTTNISGKKNIGSIANISSGTISYLSQGNEVLDSLEVEQHKLYVPNGGEYKVILNDGSEIWLNSETTLSYSNRFVDSVRCIELSGEGYFKIAHDSDKPFIVKIEDVFVKVLGTEFNIKSYRDEQETVTTLVSGSVVMFKESGENPVQLLPGEQAAWNKENNRVSKEHVNTSLYTAWKDGRFVFENSRLEDLFQILSRWYPIEVQFSDEAARNIRFTGSLKRENDIENILFIIEQNERVKFIIDENKIRVSVK